MPKRKKHFNCQLDNGLPVAHVGFGTFCHRCKPNDPRNKEKSLKGLYGPKVQQKDQLEQTN